MIDRETAVSPQHAADFLEFVLAHNVVHIGREICKEVSFSMWWETNISNPGAILEAEYCIDTTYPVWKAQIDEIPYGSPYVQANVTQTVGTISVTGSVTAGSRKAADDSATGRSSSSWREW